MAVVAARHELLGFVGSKALEAINAEAAQKLERVRPFHHQFGHVVGLVEQYAALLPRALLIAPIGVFRRYARIGVWTRLLIAQELGGVADAVQQRFKRLNAAS